MMKALRESRRRTDAGLNEAAAPGAMFPWLSSHAEQLGRETGEDFWPYNFEKNEATVSAANEIQ